MLKRFPAYEARVHRTPVLGEAGQGNPRPWAMEFTVARLTRNKSERVALPAVDPGLPACWPGYLRANWLLGVSRE